MERDECIEIVKKHSWDYLVFNHASEIDENFWEEFISEINIENLLQRSRMSDEFMLKFKDLIGEKVYKKYTAINYLCDLSNDDKDVYLDVVRSYLNHLQSKSELNYILNDYQKNSEVYEEVVLSIISKYIRLHYETLGNSALSDNLIRKISKTFLKIQNFSKEHGVAEPVEFKKYLKKLKKKGELYSAVVMTSTYDDFHEFDKLAVVLSMEVVEGIGSIEMTFTVDGSYKYNFFV